MYIRVDELSGADRVLLYGLVLERLRALRVPLSARDLVARPPPPSPPPASPLASPVRLPSALRSRVHFSLHLFFNSRSTHCTRFPQARGAHRVTYY